jgi:murein DD-endopeptidase MepM/ murein hydrolase activator NlpD
LKKTIFAVLIFSLMAFVFLVNHPDSPETPSTKIKEEASPALKRCREITGSIKRGETFFDIFKRYHLDLKDLFMMKKASADVHPLKDVCPERPYKIVVDDSDRIKSFVYWIDDDNILNVSNSDIGFSAEKIPVPYETRTLSIGGRIRDNLIASLGDDRDGLMLALQLSDIFSWDIDFTTDIREGDAYRIVAEGLYLNGEFRKYGNILSAEFVNNGTVYHAYRFERDDKPDYYSSEGESLRKAFLKAPLSFRRISSRFSSGRFHPILKLYRPHHGLDYAAPAGTPVSAAGDGTVAFAGRRGQYGKLIIMRHRNGYETYYGHLSRIAKGLHRGEKVSQGQLIGYVGSTGMATGPHLHYEMRINHRPVNPLSIKIPHGTPVPRNSLAEFRKLRDRMENRLTSISVDADVALVEAPVGLAPSRN